MKFGLIGFPLSHSFSPTFFREKFNEWKLDHNYELLEIPGLENVKEKISELNWSGFNVTVPHKQNVIALLDEISPEAEAIGAVNCVKVKNGHWTGFNTDVEGIRKSMKTLFPDGNISPALVLGNGGSAKAVRYVLNEQKIPHLVLARNGEPGTLHWDNFSPELWETYRWMIQTTPLGMYPKTEQMPPLDLAQMPSGLKAWDLIYNPAETEFLKKARRKGAQTLNGRLMLETQALAAWKIWNSEAY